MSKYTRREFFKSIVPVSVGVVSFLGGDISGKPLEIEQEYHTFYAPTNGDNVKFSIGHTETLTDHVNVKVGEEVFYIPVYGLENG